MNKYNFYCWLLSISGVDAYTRSLPPFVSFAEFNEAWNSRTACRKWVDRRKAEYRRWVLRHIGGRFAQCAKEMTLAARQRDIERHNEQYGAVDRFYAQYAPKKPGG